MGVANPPRMEAIDVARRVARDTDDVLATIPLVAGNPLLTDHLFDQLVDLLLEAILVGLRGDLQHGRLDPVVYAAELAELAAQCRRAGLLARS